MKFLSSFLTVCAMMLLSYSILPAQAAGTGAIRNPRPLPSNLKQFSDATTEELERHSMPPMPRLAELRREIKEKLRMTDEEKTNYKRSVDDPKANIIRILSAYSCNTSMVIDVSDARCADNPGFSSGSFFSFRFKDYGESPWTDLSLVEGEMTAGNKWHTIGMIADLGDANFSALDDDSAQVQALWAVPSGETVGESNEMKKKLVDGIHCGDLLLTAKARMQPNHTYLLRTLTYRVSNDGGAWVNGFNWYNTDSLFVFRVADFTDGRAATLIWKKLMQRVAPVLKEQDRNKDKDDKDKDSGR
jgi:hypothetical protein